jgi:hypothetical protein
MKYPSLIYYNYKQIDRPVLFSYSYKSLVGIAKYLNQVIYKGYGV